jgi:uncharacterized protein (DUF2236 family)
LDGAGSPRPIGAARLQLAADLPGGESCIVSRADLEMQLELVRADTASPTAGVFGPQSATWRLNREAVMFLAAGRALLLQLAHPWVGAAVADHSRVLADPLARFHRTFQIVFAVVFGDLDQAIAAARGLHERHARITGRLPAAIGCFPAGTVYHANDLAALRWVYATLIDSALAAYDLILGPVDDAVAAQYYAESRRFAAMFGIPGIALPRDLQAFRAYCTEMTGSNRLAVSGPARSLAERLLAGTGTWLYVPGSYRALTAAMLPPRLRLEFGLAGDAAERRSGERAVALIRRLYPRLPGRLRYVAPYHEAAERLAGRPPSAATRLGNRLWIGRPTLAG